MLLLLVGACGRTGDLYLPDEAQAEPVPVDVTEETAIDESGGAQTDGPYGTTEIERQSDNEEDE